MQVNCCQMPPRFDLKTFAYANNHYAGHGPGTVSQFWKCGIRSRIELSYPLQILEETGLLIPSSKRHYQKCAYLTSIEPVEARKK
jgi:hypothetical protein